MRFISLPYLKVMLQLFIIQSLKPVYKDSYWYHRLKTYFITTGNNHVCSQSQRWPQETLAM